MEGTNKFSYCIFSFVTQSKSGKLTFKNNVKLVDKGWDLEYFWKSAHILEVSWKTEAATNSEPCWNTISHQNKYVPISSSLLSPLMEARYY